MNEDMPVELLTGDTGFNVFPGRQVFWDAASRMCDGDIFL